MTRFEMEVLLLLRNSRFVTMIWRMGEEDYGWTAEKEDLGCFRVATTLGRLAQKGLVYRTNSAVAQKTNKAYGRWALTKEGNAWIENSPIFRDGEQP